MIEKYDALCALIAAIHERAKCAQWITTETLERIAEGLDEAAQLARTIRADAEDHNK